MFGEKNIPKALTKVLTFPKISSRMALTESPLNDPGMGLYIIGFDAESS